MLVAASTACFPGASLDSCLERLVGLEYSHVEIVISDRGGQLPPAELVSNVELAIDRCRQTHRLTPVAYRFDVDGDGAPYYEQFYACCRLAKATKVATIAVPSATLGTPFNGEVERLRELVRLAAIEGIVVGVKTESGRMTQDPDTVKVLCNNVKGLGVTLDPSHFICGPHAGRGYDQLLKHVCHVHLRDTSKSKLQVRVGQGEIEYGRLVNQLQREKYVRALTVDIVPEPEVDHDVELRKLRLLLESLLM